MTAALTDDEIDDRFYVQGPQQIIATLGQFIYKSIPVTVLFNDSKDFILTTLLEARPEALVFDLGGDAEANRRLLKSASCIFVTTINGIRVQFACPGGVEQIWWGEALAFAVKLPVRVLRLQRREAYRITMPLVKSIAVRLQYTQAEVVREEWCPIHNLSVSGMGITVPQLSRRQLGQVIDQVAHGQCCRLEDFEAVCL